MWGHEERTLQAERQKQVERPMGGTVLGEHLEEQEGRCTGGGGQGVLVGKEATGKEMQFTEVLDGLCLLEYGT